MRIFTWNALLVDMNSAKRARTYVRVNNPAHVIQPESAVYEVAEVVVERY